MADEDQGKDVTTNISASPIHKSASSGQLRPSADVRSSMSKSGSEGQLKDAANRSSAPNSATNRSSAPNSATKRPSAPNSARSDIHRHQPLPPIAPGENKSVDGEIAADPAKDEFASITESELAEGDVHTIVSEDEDHSWQIVEDDAKKNKTGRGNEVETQTEWSWIETMKSIQQQQAVEAEHQVAPVLEHLVEPAGGRGSVVSKASRTSKAGTLASQSSRRQSTLLKEKPADITEPERSITGTVEEGPPEVMTTLVLPYRDDEYGVPVLQFSESDTDSESETTISKPKTNKTLPSIGPPQILQYKRDVKADDSSSLKGVKGGEIGQGDLIDEEPMNIDTVNELITFTGNCEFCNNAIKPFPTLHQQQILTPQELYCCEEFANFVRLAILPPPPNSHLIDIKPHAHYGSKQARAAAREKAQARIREREMQKVSQSHHSAHTGSGTGPGSGAGGASGPPGASAPGGAHHPSQTTVGGSGGAQMGGGGGAGGNMFAYARTMKTINFQLSSQRCIDEGYVVRPPSPLLDQESIANPFEIEPLEWYSPMDEIDWEEDEALHALRDKPGGFKRRCVERYYPNEEKFLTMLPDGTGNVYYPNGQLAVSVSSTSPGCFTYLVYDMTVDDSQEQQLLAQFEPDAVATCYHRSTGNIRLFLDQLGGLEAHPDGSKRRKWHWLDQSTHQHAPPVQPLCFALNKSIGIRVLNQDNISMTFLSYHRSCRFNVGVKLKLVHPENLPSSIMYDDGQIFMSEKANQVSAILDKIDNLLKYPHSSRADKIKVAKRVTIRAERIEKQKQQSILARENERLRRTKKYSRPLPPIEQNDIDPVLMTETGDLSTRGGGRAPKHPVVVVN